MGTAFSIAFIITTIILCFILAVLRNTHSKKRKAFVTQFLDEEHMANSSRKKDIDPSLLYEPDESLLAFVGENDPHGVLKTSKKQMIYFSEPMTNLDIKRRFGASQVERVAQFEENYAAYLKAFVVWGQALHSENNLEEAIVVIMHSISLGAEIRIAYKLAADIFVANNDMDGLDELLSYAESNYFKDEVVRNHIINYISQARGDFDE